LAVLETERRALRSNPGVANIEKILLNQMINATFWYSFVTLDASLSQQVLEE